MSFYNNNQNQNTTGYGASQGNSSLGNTSGLGSNGQTYNPSGAQNNQYGIYNQQNTQQNSTLNNTWMNSTPGITGNSTSLVPMSYNTSQGQQTIQNTSQPQSMTNNMVGYSMNNQNTFNTPITGNTTMNTMNNQGTLGSNSGNSYGYGLNTQGNSLFANNLSGTRLGTQGISPEGSSMGSISPEYKGNSLFGSTLGNSSILGSTSYLQPGGQGLSSGSMLSPMGNTGYNSSIYSSMSRPGSPINSTLLSSASSNQNEYLMLLEYLEKAYSKDSPFYKFTYVFYNLIDNTKPTPTRPYNVSAEIWAQAEKNNPNPSLLYPTVIQGYNDLYLRLQKQLNTIERLKSTRKYFGDKINSLIETGTLRLSNKVSAIIDKYNVLLVEVLDQISKSLGPAADSTSIHYKQLEKRVNLLSEGLNTLTENLSIYKRQFIFNKIATTTQVLEEQRTILLSMITTVKDKLKDK
ncbi:hypothetical protein NEOKW01_0106 [Nematocida sp. AWRm80]|nr:hypothetical protein NEOKW01_0106 [Nematocida sp. AWRm80]